MIVPIDVWPFGGCVSQPKSLDTRIVKPMALIRLKMAPGTGRCLRLDSPNKPRPVVEA